MPSNRRTFLKDSLNAAGGIVLGTGAGLVLPSGHASSKLWSTPTDTVANVTSESLVKTLYDSLSPKQRETICFGWNHVDGDLGLLRSRISANWEITDETLNGGFYTDDQRAIIRGIFEGIYNPEWHARIDQQLDDDSGGYGESNTIAIFGEPGSDQFEFVLTGRHMTVRCDGNTTEHVAFGGPIFYGHAADDFNEGPDHKDNVFWPQALSANRLFDALDGKQREQALISKGERPKQSDIAFQGKEGKFQGIAIADLAADQKQLVQETLQKLLEPYRQTDRKEVAECLGKQGGLDACHMAYYADGDIGNDQVWDCWQLEGPSFVWHYRGAPHVHVWVNVADDAGVETNAG